MPLINGICAPPVCFRLTFDTTQSRIEVFDTVKGAVDPVRTANAQALCAPDLAAHRARLAAAVVLQCDGCTCFRPRRPPRPVALAPQVLPIPPSLPRFPVQIVGTTYRFHQGVCFPPGTVLPPGKNAWVPMLPCGCNQGDCTCPTPPSPGGKKKNPKKKKSAKRPRR